MTEITSTLDELQSLRELSNDVAAAMQAQRDVLRQRGMSLPHGVLSSLEGLAKDLRALEKGVTADETELGQLRALAATGAMVNSSLDLDQVLTQAMDRVIELAGAERGFIILQNVNTGEMEFRIARDNSEEPQDEDHRISRTILNEVVSTGRPLLTDNAYKDPRIQDNMSIAQFMLRSVICVPLQKGDKIIGAVYVDNRVRSGVFTQLELNLLTAFGNQATVAIENARLYARIQSTLSEIREMKNLMDNVFASIGSGVITTDADRRIMTMNRAAEAMLSVTAEESIGKRIMAVLPRIDEADVEDQLREVLQGDKQEVIQAEVEMPARGQVILNLKLSPLLDDDENVQGAAVVVDDLTEQVERENMFDVMSDYLPPGLLDRLDEIMGIDLGGERREMTCMFIETRSFGSFPQDTPPQRLMTMVNEYLSVATAAVHEMDGVIDKYMGSELMVLFNTQLNPQEDHAARAIHAALNVRDAFEKFYASLNINPEPHYYRIGVHSGIATLGNVGSLYRRNFTAIGDTINLSKRLQENATAGQIIISETTLDMAQRTGSIDDIRLVERDPIQVKGRQVYTQIYEVFANE